MGVDYYTCTHCEETFPDCADGYRSCDGCRKLACPTCATMTQYFSYDGKPRCSDCWNDDPVFMTDEHVLAYVLNKFGVTEDDMRDELRAKEARFREPEHRYTCTAHKPACASADCETLKLTHGEERGLCCNAKDDVEPCGPCKKRKISSA